MEQMGERLSADIDFPKVLFLHINRVAQSPSNDMFAANVEMLESLLCHYVDEEYFVDIKTPDREFRSVLALDGSTHGKDDMIAAKKMFLIQEKFRALMRLANRRNLLIQRTDRDEVWELGEDNDTESETTNDD